MGKPRIELDPDKNPVVKKIIGLTLQTSGPGPVISYILGEVPERHYLDYLCLAMQLAALRSVDAIIDGIKEIIESDDDPAYVDVEVSGKN
jgi:hypothetical protein